MSNVLDHELGSGILREVRARRPLACRSEYCDRAFARDKMPRIESSDKAGQYSEANNTTGIVVGKSSFKREQRGFAKRERRASNELTFIGKRNDVP
jgi:hypothetical protein